MGDQTRRERIAHNEATARSSNEALGFGLRAGGLSRDDRIGFLCECGDDGCDKLVHVRLALYEEVRQDSRRFLIVPGHDFPEAENVVQTTTDHAIVQKHENVRDIVEDRDPRRP